MVSSLAQRLVCPSRVTTYHNCSSVWMHASPIAYLLYTRYLLIEPAQPLLGSHPARRSQARDGHHSQASMVRPKLDVTASVSICLFLIAATRAIHLSLVCPVKRTLIAPYTNHERPPLPHPIPPSTTFCSSRHL